MYIVRVNRVPTENLQVNECGEGLRDWTQGLELGAEMERRIDEEKHYEIILR